MKTRDSLGRKRSAEQSRGLKPLHPELPDQWVSKAVRIAMSEADWTDFEAFVSEVAKTSPTLARAYGDVLSRLLHIARANAPAGPTDWMDWERAKTLRLLRWAG